MPGALAGLRFVEFAGLGPAPFAAMMLADHGAEVLRIHAPRPRRGVATVDTQGDVLARNRASVAVDLKTPEGRALVLDLIAQADGLIEGFRPGVLERLGLGPSECLAVNPRLAYGRMTGWGQDGPLAPRAGHDINYIALSGTLSAIGTADRPVPPLNLLGDFGGGGMFLAFGLLAAVLSARTTGHGQVVDAAMTDGAAVLSAMIHGLRNAGAWQDGREANLLDGGAFFYRCYECADGGFVAVGAIESQFHLALMRGLNLDPADFPQDDPARWPELTARLAEVFATKPRDHWTALFEGTDACVTPVLRMAEAQAHPHNAARGTFTGGLPAPAPRFTATPPDQPSPPILPESDPTQLLSAWGITPHRTASLIQTGILHGWDS